MKYFKKIIIWYECNFCCIKCTKKTGRKMFLECMSFTYCYYKLNKRFLEIRFIAFLRLRPHEIFRLK